MMKTGQVTIKDIAKQLNISPSTVSRALRNHPDISPETKKAVNDLAKELDYHPDSVAQSLQKRRTNLIGVIVPEIKHNFFSAAISGIEKVAYRAGYAIIVSQSNENYEREVVNVRALMSNRVAGLLISISQNTIDSEHFRLLERQNTPFVFFDRVCEDVSASKVMVDDFAGAYTATEHLINKGYQRIAHLAGPKHISISKKRLDGYKSALKRSNMLYDERLVVYGGLNEEDGRLGFQQLLQLKKMPDAIFAVNDPVAIGAFEKIKEHGLRIPKDIALVGFSNNPISALVDPSLTTVEQPAYEVGKRAAMLLIEQINSGDNFVPREEVLKTKLIVRNST